MPRAAQPVQKRETPFSVRRRQRGGRKVLQTEQPTLTLDLPRDISCFRLPLPKGTLFSEEGPEIRSVVVAEVRAMEGWLPDNFELAGGGLACIGLGEDGSTYLASNVLDPAAKAQQPAHTDFSPTLWDWDADGVKGTASRMEQLCVHALLVKLYARLRWTPAFVRSDNRAEFISLTQRDRCEISNATSAAAIEPGSPWEVGFCGSIELQPTAPATGDSRLQSSTPS